MLATLANGGHRTIRALVLPLAVLTASGCKVDHHPRTLHYADGIVIQGWDPPQFKYIRWHAAGHSTPCPLVVHLSDGDLGLSDLADPATLRRAGWTQEGDASWYKLTRPRPPFLYCEYDARGLAGVNVFASTDLPITVSVGDRRLSLPANDEDIAQALGPPESESR
jgi:hypothetical protein